MKRAIVATVFALAGVERTLAWCQWDGGQRPQPAGLLPIPLGALGLHASVA